MNTIKVTNISELKNRKGTIESTVEVLGYYISGDGGGGTFYWDNTSTAADNGGTTIQVTGITTGRWMRNYNNEISVKWFGAKGDGTFDDTNFIQSSLNFSIANDLFLTVNKGEYKITSTIIKPQSFKGINLKGVIGTKFKYSGTSNTPIISIVGGSGQLCHSKIENIIFEGTNTQIGIEINGQCGQKIENCSFLNLSEGVLFFNKGVGAFTEWNIITNSRFMNNVILPIHYKSTNSEISFHGSGLSGENWIVKSENTNPVVLIDNGCLVYNSPLNFQIWNEQDCILIKNNNTSLSNSFYGNITCENFNNKSIKLAEGITYFTGNLISLGDRIDSGDLIKADKIIINSIGTTFLSGVQYQKRFILNTGATTINPIIPVGTYNIILKIVAPNYDYRYTMLIDHDGYGGAGYVTDLQAIKTFNGTGYGSPTFTVDTNGKLIITNVNYPLNTCTIYIKYIQVFDYTIQNVPNKDF